MNHVSFYLLLPDREVYTSASKLTLIFCNLAQYCLFFQSTNQPPVHSIVHCFGILHCLNAFFIFLQKPQILSFRFLFLKLHLNSFSGFIIMNKLITSQQTSALSAFINKFHANTYVFVIQNSNYFELHRKFNLEEKNPHPLQRNTAKAPGQIMQRWCQGPLTPS